MVKSRQAPLGKTGIVLGIVILTGMVFGGVALASDFARTGDPEPIVTASTDPGDDNSQGEYADDDSSAVAGTCEADGADEADEADGADEAEVEDTDEARDDDFEADDADLDDHEACDDDGHDDH